MGCRGDLRKDAFEQARDFAGIAFRISKDRSEPEIIYLRPTNARSDDQLRQNHSIQCVSHPDYLWHRLRRKNSAKYESYADMAPGAWVRGQTVLDFGLEQ
ncbi:MAG: hypothetical protein CMQ21_00895 [Gammaproteobacteria bacterium]|jgi:hypothetical protein|nr:hypothetical protein [Gammaproteobacteria bacterium]